MSFPSLFESFSLISPLSLFFCLGEDFQYISLFSKKNRNLESEILPMRSIATGTRTCPILLPAQQKDPIRIRKLLGLINSIEKTGHV